VLLSVSEVLKDLLDNTRFGDEGDHFEFPSAGTEQRVESNTRRIKSRHLRRRACLWAELGGFSSSFAWV